MFKKDIFSFFFFLFSLNILFLSCKSSTNPSDLVTVNGNVYLEGQSDHSGVRVSIYKPVELDTALVRLNEQYPNIGVPISQTTEFDHRYENALYSVLSQSDGSWEIDKVRPGIYNFVAEKDSYGWKYLFEQKVDILVNFDTLFNIIYLDNLNQDLSIRNRYIIIDNLIIPDNEILTVEDASNCVIKENSKLTVYGNLIIRGSIANPIRIFSEGGEEWDYAEFMNNSHIILQYCIIKNGLQGIYNKTSQLIFENNIIRNNNIGLQNFNFSDSISIINNLFSHNSVALYNNSVNKSGIFNNIFISNKESIRLTSNSYFDIQKNIFYNDSLSIGINEYLLTSLSSGKIMWCHFSDNQVNILLGRNIFDFLANYNNFIEPKQYFIIADFGPKAKVDTVNFTNNYWGTLDRIEIKNRISDIEKYPDINEGYYVNIDNFLFEPVDINN